MSNPQLHVVWLKNIHKNYFWKAHKSGILGAQIAFVIYFMYFLEQNTTIFFNKAPKWHL